MFPHTAVGPALAAVLLLLPGCTSTPPETPEPGISRGEDPQLPGAPETAVHQRLGLSFAVGSSELRRSIISTDTPWGFSIAAVEPDSWAARVGLAPGDLVMEWDGRPIREVDELARWVGELDAGASATLRCTRRRADASIWSRKPWEDFTVAYAGR